MGIGQKSVLRKKGQGGFYRVEVCKGELVDFDILVGLGRIGVALYIFFYLYDEEFFSIDPVFHTGKILFCDTGKGLIDFCRDIFRNIRQKKPCSGRVVP